MSHYAIINEENKVITVLYYDNSVPESDIEEYHASEGNRVIKTSYNTSAGVHKQGGVPLRANFASVGFTYDEDNDVFIEPKPYESWILNEESFIYEPPIPLPEDYQDQERNYFWDEENLKWSE